MCNVNVRYLYFFSQRNLSAESIAPYAPFKFVINLSMIEVDNDACLPSIAHRGCYVTLSTTSPTGLILEIAF